MKAVMMAIRMLTNAFGNVIDVVVIALLKDVFDSQVRVEYFLVFSKYDKLSSSFWIMGQTPSCGLAYWSFQELLAPMQEAIGYKKYFLNTFDSHNFYHMLYFPSNIK